MARTELSTSLAHFEKVVSKMRDLGVASWTNSPVGDIVLGPPQMLAKPEEKGDAKQTSIEARRKEYEMLFNKPMSDAELKRLP